MSAETSERPNILVTNDDGIDADGIAALREALEPLGNVMVVAPDREQSAASHAVTLRNPLRVNRIDENVISVDGTPTDCVLLAVNGLLASKPDYKSTRAMELYLRVHGIYTPEQTVRGEISGPQFYLPETQALETEDMSEMETDE